MEHAKNDLLATGKKIILQESQALQELAGSLGDEFYQALQIILKRQGRIAVSGVGKSSHIGRKISATLASTGSPAYFIHPGEAAHGDLGMLVASDTLLAISNSGATRELFPLVAFCRDQQIPIIAITRDRQSHLAQMATVVLQLNHTSEAGTLGIAPTTSTTCTVALGDALALALAQARGFGREDFHNLHPGGWLGIAIKIVRDLMRAGSAMPVVGEDTPASQVLVEMAVKSLGCAVVCGTNGQLTGIITDGDIRRHSGADIMSRTARQLMTAGPITIEPSATVGAAVLAMNSHKITSMPVVEDGRLLGILHLHDCLNPEIVL